MTHEPLRSETMPKERDYRISLNPLEPRYRDGKLTSWRTTFSLRGDRGPEASVRVATFAELDEEVRALFDSTDWDHASAFVEVIDGGRKPNGFDAWRDEHHRYSREGWTP